MDSDFNLNDCSENYEQLLKAMGFIDENEIKQALSISKNDINEAVAILTNEKLPKLTSLTRNTDENEIMMSESDQNSANSSNQFRDSNLNESNNENNLLVFPTQCLVQLENSVFVDSWSIPYKKDEWLDRILQSTIALLKEGVAEAEQNCKRFMDRVIPEVYRKLLDSGPVGKWNYEIQQGVYNMTCLVIELIAIRLNQEGVPDILLNTLSLIFNSESMFHNKHHLKLWDKSHYTDLFGGLENCFTQDVDRYGWLLNFINLFGSHKGFDGIKAHSENTNDIEDFNSLMKPLASCSEFLNPTIIKSMFENSFIKMFENIKALDGEDFKDKNVGRVFDLLQTMKKLSIYMWPTELENFHQLHLDVVLKMLKYSHFNSKMNSLKEICKLIENAKGLYNKTIIKEEILSKWIISERILSIAVEENIDQSQYCEKVKTIVEFIGDQITNEEISALWNMQYNKSISLVDNLYVIIGIAATKFNSEQLDFLLAQVIQTWNDYSFKLHDKLVGLLRMIGREAKSNKIYSKILETLWELKNRPGLSKQLLLLIYNEHLSVLNGGRLPRETSKSVYIKKCFEELKKAPGSSIAIASLRHMYDIMNSYQKNNSKAMKEVLSDIVLQLLKNLCTNLLKCHSNAYEKAKLLNQKFDHTTLVDDIFTHEEVVQTHLNLIKFVLQEGNLYLNLGRALEIWDILIENEHSSDWDKNIGFEWFIDCQLDLNDDSRAEIFKKRILNLPAAKLSPKGYECFKLYFVRVNENESKLQIKSDLENFIIDKLDLTGLNYLWDIILFVNDEQIADMATKFLLDISYEKVSFKLKREVLQLHQRFINECYSRLENCLISLETSPIGQMLLDAFRITYLSVSLTEMNAVPIATKTQIFKCIERILMIAERYIIAVEENASIQRANLPHFMTFKSESFSLIINSDNRNSFELFVCSNETLGDLRARISNYLSSISSNIQIYLNDKLMSQINDSKLLNSLNIDGMQPLCVKVASSYPSSLNQTPVKDSSLFFSTRVDPEQEKCLPGILIANNSSAFDMLNRLEDFEEPKIRQRVRNITKLIPTNPRLLEAFDSIIGKHSVITSTVTTASVAAASSGLSNKLTKSPSSSSINIQNYASPIQNSTFQSLNASSSQQPQQQTTSLSTPSTPTSMTFTNNPFNQSNQAAAQSQASATAFSSVKTSAVAAMSSFFSKRTDSMTSLDSRGSFASPSTSSGKDLSKYFDKSVPLHRVLYHLEALSSRLMPSSNDLTAQQNAELFQQDFLKANGLEVLLSLLNLESNHSKHISSANRMGDYETKQDIYILLLQLIRLVFFGSYYSLNPSNVQNMIMNSSCVNKRPASEPITTCAKKTITPSMISTNELSLNQSKINTGQNLLVNDSNDNSSQSQNNVFSLLQRMTVSEVVDTITHLLVIYWGAAAGNIQLAYNTPLVSNSNVSIGNQNQQDTLLLRPNPNSSCSSSPSLAKKTLPQTSSNIFSTTSSLTASGDLDLPTNEIVSLNIDVNNVENELLDTFDSNLNKSQKEVKFFIANNRLSTGSNMSTSSIDSASDNQSQTSQFQYSPNSSSFLHSGICIKQTSISTKDIKIASKAIEMITCFVQYRKDCLSHLLNMKLFNECIIDVLTGSISKEIRVYTEKFLLKLSQIETSAFKCKDHLISLIIKARLPLWLSSSLTRKSSQNLIAQSTEYFNLRCALLDNMNIDEQSAYSIDIKKMLNDEVNWFTSFTPTKSLKHLDNILLTGHLNITRSLLTCETANKADIGDEIIPQLVKTFLFPASYLITTPSEDTTMEPICSAESSRLASYKLLVELSRNCLKNYSRISTQLISFHHIQNQSNQNEWNFIPLVTPRAECGYVGLKNGGATCYMNAVLQQLYMIPSVTDYLLSIEDESDKNSVFWQLQNVMAHLKESKLEYYMPEPFWKAFRLWGQEVNIREQQDAFDFFISMTDQIDEHLKKLNKEPIFKNVFEGTFSNQFICKDCPHKYEREEVFLGLNLPIKSGNLEESLSQFVKDELLDGQNSYYCEKCNEKRSAIKRTCIKKLPKYLCIQLKRFDYDWESNRSLKFDDYFQFPRRLDVAPYTYESINKTRDDDQTDQMDTAIPYIDQQSSTTISSKCSTQLNDEMIKYELVGIVVHSGQANAGHYYSFIREPKSNHLNSEQELYELEQLNQSFEETFPSAQNQIISDAIGLNPEASEKWYKFNDTTVEEINFDMSTMIEECFGGTFTQTSDYKMLPEERVRYWNGYMLFYKEPENSSLKLSLREAKMKQRKEFLANAVNKAKISRDSLSELAELVSRGDEKGLFRTNLPPAIERIVKMENLEFCKNREIYEYDYFQFIYKMVKIFKENFFLGENRIKENNSLFAVESTNLGLEFLYNTYFKTGKKLRTDVTKWYELFKELLNAYKESAICMLNFVVTHETNSSFIRHYLLECPILEIRETCSQLFETCLHSLIVKFDLSPLNNVKINTFITSLVQLLDKTVIDLCKNSQEYFKFMFSYASMSKDTTQQLISLGLFGRLLCFLLGNPGSIKSDETSNRRWSSFQLRELAIVYELISLLALKCNILSFTTCDIPAENSLHEIKMNEQCENVSTEMDDQYPVNESCSEIKFKVDSFTPPKNSDDQLPLGQEMQIYLFGALSIRFSKELVYAFEHINTNSLPKTLELILTCCYCNEAFSANMINQILTHVNNSSSNEIKQALGLLYNIIMIEDPLQLKRFILTIDGFKDIKVEYFGLLSIIRQNQSSDAKKSYQCVKFIVTVANNSSSCKEYLLKSASNWEWSVNWLKNKMADSSLGSSQYINWNNSKYQSNEDSDIKTFQRTKSAQRTLDEATALLKSTDIDN